MARVFVDVAAACLNSLRQKCGAPARMVTGTKFRDDRSRLFLYLAARKFEPVTIFAESTISATMSSQQTKYCFLRNLELE
jgi:hypothetical protein